MNTWEEKLQEFETYEKDWDSYGANPITKQAITSAKQVIEILLGLNFPVPRPIPMSTGGIALEWHTISTEFAIEIGEHGEVDSLFLYGDHLNSFELTRPQ